MNKKQREMRIKMIDAGWSHIGYVYGNSSTEKSSPLFERGPERSWIDERGNVWAVPVETY